MAVYTEVTDEALAAYLIAYDIGAMVAFRGIAEGVENSNFLLRTDIGRFHPHAVREARRSRGPAVVPRADGASRQRGITCPQPVRGRDGEALRHARRPPRRDHHLPPGRLAAPRTAGALRAGRRGAGALHRRRQRTTRRRAANALRPGRLAAAAGAVCATRCGQVQPGLRMRSCRGGLWRHLVANWPSDLPRGHIHADLFPDNVFFLDGRLVRPDRLLFRLQPTCSPTTSRSASTPGASSRTALFNVTKARRAAAGLQRGAAAVSEAEQAALPVLARARRSASC